MESIGRRLVPILAIMMLLIETPRYQPDVCIYFERSQSLTLKVEAQATQKPILH